MDFDKRIQSAKSEIVKFFESKSKSRSRAQDLTKLEELVEGKQNPLSQAINRCKGLFNKLLDRQMNRKDYDEVNRTQEHLSNKGSIEHDQVKALQDHLKTKGADYDPLKKELDSFIPADIMFSPSEDLPKNALYKQITKLDIAVSHGLRRHLSNKTNTGGERAQAIKARIEKLEPGESVLIDVNAHNLVGAARKYMGGHAMVMRLTRNQDGTYKLEFANTGLGIRNEKFHPRSSLEPHKCQTVACISNIPKEKLLESNFFETFCSISNGEDIPAKSCLDPDNAANTLLKPNEDEYKSIKNRIDALYLCLETLGNPEKIMDENSGYYSRPQIGGSCTISSLWAISRVISNPILITEMENDLKLKSLLRNYKLIENGYDQSSTRKIMVLDQVESLMLIYKGDEKTVARLSKIEEKLKHNLGLDRSERIVSKKGRVDLKHCLEREGTSPGEFSLKSMRGKLTPQKGKLKLDVNWKTNENSSVRYNVVEDSPNHFQGKTRADSMFLLYFAIVNGDQKSCEDYIGQVLNHTQDGSDPDKMHEIKKCLSDLMNDLSESNTRSDIAKKYFLGRLLEVVDPESRASESVKSHYIAMDVEAHFGSDNIWVAGIKALPAVQEALQQKAVELAAEKLEAAKLELAQLESPEDKYQAAMSDRYDRVTTRQLLADAAALGHVESQFELGADYYIKREFNEAVKYLQMAADQGHLSAQLKLAACYSRGAIDLNTAVKYYLMAANQGDKGAQGNLGEIYEKGGPDVPRDLLKAIQYYQLAGNANKINALISDPTSRSEIIDHWKNNPSLPRDQHIMDLMESKGFGLNNLDRI